MEKELSEMTPEELWKLFPIVLKEHNIKYKDWYEIEKQKLLNCIDRKLKLELAKKYKYHRDGYTDAKSDFVLKYTQKAKEEYGNKYNPRKWG